MTYTDAAKLIATWVDVERKSMDRSVQRILFKVADVITSLEHDWDEVYGHINIIIDRLNKIEQRLDELELKPINIAVVENKNEVN